MVQRGVVAMKGRIISSGKLVVKNFVMHNAKRDYNVRGITCTVFSLTKSNMEAIFDRNELPTIKPKVRKFACQLAFRRAFVRYAKGKWTQPAMRPVRKQSYYSLAMKCCRIRRAMSCKQIDCQTVCVVRMPRRRTVTFEADGKMRRYRGSYLEIFVWHKV